MDEGKPSVAIVGAGPFGLAASHYLAESHAVYLFDAKKEVGGVWAAGEIDEEGGGGCSQAYEWLETNTPRALFACPHFPLGTEVSERERSDYVSSKEAKKYFADFARENKLHDRHDDGGRLKRLCLGQRVKEVRYERDASGKNCWSFFSQSSDKEEKKWSTDKLVLALGAFSSAKIPSAFVPLMTVSPTNEYILHVDRLQSARTLRRLEQARRVVIVGSGKSALDLIAELNVNTQGGVRKQIIVIQRKGEPQKDEQGLLGVWPAPRHRLSAMTGRMPFLGAGYLSPWAPLQVMGVEHGAGSGLSSFMRSTMIGEMCLRAFWFLLASLILISNPLLSPSISTSSMDILLEGARVFPAPKGLRRAKAARKGMRVISTSIQSVKKRGDFSIEFLCEDEDETIHIDGELGHDMVILCTGYRGAADTMSDVFLHKHQAAELGIPLSGEDESQACHPNASHDREEWRNASLRAFSRLSKEAPLLRKLCSYRDNFFGDCASTFKLYDHILPISDAVDPATAPNPPFAALGLPQTLSAPIVADLQARYVAAWFTARHRPSLLVKSRHEALDRTAMLVNLSMCRYGCKDSRHGTMMAFELSWYADLLLNRIDHLHNEKSSGRRPRWSEPFRPMHAHDWK